MANGGVITIPCENRSSTENNPDYFPVLESVTDDTRKLLEEYGKIPTEEVIPHCIRIRDQGWKVFPFPCIGRFRFLVRTIGVYKEYPEILERVKDGQKLLDLGCCFGQDVRRLAADGAPTANIYGCDLSLQFLDLGYDLFRDRDTLKATFFAADIFDISPESPLNKYDGFFDVIHASSFFHLFDWDSCVKAAIRALKLLKHQPGSLLIGRQLGVHEPGSYSYDNRILYAHDEHTLDKFWRQVISENGYQAEVQVAADSEETQATTLSDRPRGYRLRYSVRLV